MIRCLYEQGPLTSKIHRELCIVYEPTVNSDEKFKHRCRDFRNGRINVHDEERSNRPKLEKLFLKEIAT